MENKTNNTKKYILLTMGVTALGVGSYFGWQYWQNHNAEKSNSDENDLPALPNYKPDSSAYTPAPVHISSDEFPLKKGSRGAKVKALQEALIGKYGVSILPKYGADGDFGSEMQNALAKKGLPSAMDESTFNLLVKGAAPESGSLAKRLVNAAISSNFNEVINALKQVRSKDDYQSVSNEFKLFRVRGVHQTLVNGLLNSFSDESKKQQIRLEFLRMGLKYDGNHWSLNGVDEYGFSLHW